METILSVFIPASRVTTISRLKLSNFTGLKYNAKKHRWDGTKIYDPQRGIRASLTVEFTEEGQLKLRGSILGIGESVYWDKIEE